jgi:hypothetical protein
MKFELLKMIVVPVVVEETHSFMSSDAVIYELEALKSIYGQDFEERAKVWNNISFAIRVRPMMYQSKDIYSG